MHFKRKMLWAVAPAALGLMLSGCPSKSDGGANGGGTTGGSTGGTTGGEAVKIDPASAGSIAVTVKYEGEVPAPEPVDMGGDPVCAEHNPKGEITPAIVVGNGGALANAFVYVKEGLKGTFPTPTEKVVFDQKNCEYNPHVFGIMVNQTLEIVNSDPTLHNVHSLPKKNTPINEGMPKQGDKLVKKFKAVEVPVPIKCDVHGWMKAYACVVDHPYYSVTDKTGKVMLKDVPPGEYTIEVWHEKLGTQTQKVTVGAKETKELAVSFK